MSAVPNPREHVEQAESRPRAIGLVRVSTEEQSREGRGGIPRQRAAIEAIAVRHGLNVVEVVEIVDVSGSDMLQDVQARRILTLVENGSIAGVVVDAFDRLCRTTKFADLAILQPFQDRGAKIWTATQTFDFGQQQSLLLPGLHALIAGDELAKIRARISGANEAKRRRGEAPNNCFPKGVSADPATRKFIYTAEIAVVQEIGRLFDEERVHNYREIARRVGVTAPTVRNILRNPAYIGVREYLFRQSGKKRISKRTQKVWKEREARPSHEIIRVPTGLEPIFDKATFERRLRIMAEMKNNYIERRDNTTFVHIASGVVRCWCGSPLLCSTTTTHGVRRGYFSCRRNSSPYKKKDGGCSQPHLRDTDVDSGVWNLATRLLSDPERLTHIITTTLKRAQETIHPFPLDQETELRKLRGQRDRLLDAYQEGAISLDDLKARRAKIETRMGQIQNSRPTLPLVDDVEGMVRRIVLGVALLPTVQDNFERKKIVHSLLTEVRIEKRSIIGFRLHPDFASPDSEYFPLDDPFQIAPEPTPEGYSTCSSCTQTLPLNAFYAGRKSQCKTCVKAATTRRRLAARRC